MKFDTKETKKIKKETCKLSSLRGGIENLEKYLVITKSTREVLFSEKKRKYYVPGSTYGFDKIFSEGNSKLDKSILIFSMLPVVTCLNCKNCKNSCYAKKAVNQYDNTWNKRLIVSYMAINHLDTLEKWIREELSKTKKKYVRIHESGDFISIEYTLMWERIIKDFPNINFYFYTKMEIFPKFKTIIERIHNMPNGNRCNSFLPNGGLNYGPIGYILDAYNRFHFPVCSYGMTKEEKRLFGIKEDLVCGKNCFICIKQEHVLIKEH